MRLALFVVFIVLTACQSTPNKELQVVAVTFPEKETLNFTGRGSMAAMMMI